MDVKSLGAMRARRFGATDILYIAHHSSKNDKITLIRKPAIDYPINAAAPFSGGESVRSLIPKGEAQ